jgi:hypothetical protein
MAEEHGRPVTMFPRGSNPHKPPTRAGADEERRLTMFPRGTNHRAPLPTTEDANPLESEDLVHDGSRPKKHRLTNPSSEVSELVSPLPRRISRPTMQITLLERNPWIIHTPVVSVKHSGFGIVAEKEAPKGKMVFIRRVGNCKREDLRALKSASHINILALTAAYFHEESIYLVYNYLPVTLKEVAQGYLTTSQIATVCNAIVNGLDYLHQELGIIHGDLHMTNVVISREGHVKIGMNMHGIFRELDADIKGES